ncbi:P-loop NTPase family protein [Glacieibacterium frigidum]|uniref:AAA family ATPase n=1 Tax=Glacieibacterium frigidum TaxID=2593303 RepID=A0A552UFC3_9SPHN|nr:AAA family ATPase [Glacieibacterium frigidum]TRW16923.1 AAA family ATPase [Glacieibacterium frigidum]
MTLDDLGPRICILGPSNSGKSTLAAAIGRARGLPAVHLDQLQHLPGTDWVQRPEAEFGALHDAVIAGERWVIDGNYSRLLPQRLERATGIIALDLSTARSLWRYVRRTLFERDRVGALDGGRERVKWEMIHHIAVATPPRSRRQAALLETTDLPGIRLPNPKALTDFYRAQGLTR